MVSARNELPSWSDGAARRAIVAFVESTTRAGGPGYVPLEARVAVFDADGTPWCEKPLPVHADFLLHRLAEIAGREPTLRERQPWKAAFERDYAWLGNVISKHHHGDDHELKATPTGTSRCCTSARIPRARR